MGFETVGPGAVVLEEVREGSGFRGGPAGCDTEWEGGELATFRISSLDGTPGSSEKSTGAVEGGETGEGEAVGYH